MLAAAHIPPETPEVAAGTSGWGVDAINGAGDVAGCERLGLVAVGDGMTATGVAVVVAAGDGVDTGVLVSRRAVAVAVTVVVGRGRGLGVGVGGVNVLVGRSVARLGSLGVRVLGAVVGVISTTGCVGWIPSRVGWGG